MMGRLSDSVQHVEVDGRRVRITHLERVLWPDSGTTKAEMLDYYVRVAPALLPHLRRRPLTLWRYPEGVQAQGWWQNECRGAPDWMAVYEYDATDGRHHRHCVIDDVSSLLWVANQGTIELHPFLFVADRPQVPLAVIFDLDPGEPATLRDACDVGLRLRQLLNDAGLRSFAKSSGSKGLHVVVPLNQPHTFDETKAFARAAAHILADERDDVVDRHSPADPRREGAGRLAAERSLPLDRRAVLAAGDAASHGFDARRVGGRRACVGTRRRTAAARPGAGPRTAGPRRRSLRRRPDDASATPRFDPPFVGSIASTGWRSSPT